VACLCCGGEDRKIRSNFFNPKHFDHSLQLRIIALLDFSAEHYTWIQTTTLDYHNFVLRNFGLKSFNCTYPNSASQS
jgi:hypothetical protein